MLTLFFKSPFYKEEVTQDCSQDFFQCFQNSLAHNYSKYSVHFNRSVVSNCLRPRGLQHARLPCPSPTPRACSNSCPSNHLILCCSLLLLLSIFPSIRVFSNESVLHIRWPKYWSFSVSISPSNEIQSWFPLGLTGLISVQSKGF